MSMLQGLVYTFLLILSLFTASSYCSPVECCKPEVGLENRTKLCNDRSKINLNCSTGIYMRLDLNKDSLETIYVDSSDSLVYINDLGTEEENFSPDTYCQANLNDKSTFIVCVSDTESSRTWQHFVYGLSCIASSFFAALTLIIYWILPELRELQDKAMMSLCASFMVGSFVLGMMNVGGYDHVTNDSACVATACLMYYFLLSNFFWMNVTSLNIWKTVWFPGSRVNNHKFYVAYCLFGWGIPGGFLAFAIITHFFDVSEVKPHFSEGSCWFNNIYSTWIYFYGPILALVLTNFIYLGLTVCKLWHIYVKLNCSRVKVLRVKCAMCLKLSIIMGATWIFEIISFYVGDKTSFQFLFYFMDVINGLQGFFIFIVLVILRDKVKILLAKRKVCNISFPKSWAHCENTEKWDENEIDEFQLSQK